MAAKASALWRELGPKHWVKNVFVLAALVFAQKLSDADAVVAAGAVLTNDAPAQKNVLGSPARLKKEVPEGQLLDNQSWVD